MKEREEKIKQYRLKQPVAELERKAIKSRERANLYTQEELDLAAREAMELFIWREGSNQ
jgi:hypothetical protein